MQVRYVHDRRACGHKRTLGTLPLDKPSLLTLPVQDGAAANVDLAVRPPAHGVDRSCKRMAGKAPAHHGGMTHHAVGGSYACAAMHASGTGAAPVAAPLPGLQFCGPALVLANVAVAASGALRVPLEELPGDWSTGATPLALRRWHCFSVYASSMQ